jgi:hypothetical protein
MAHRYDSPELPDASLNLSKYATAELRLVVDLDHYAVREKPTADQSGS